MARHIANSPSVATRVQPRKMPRWHFSWVFLIFVAVVAMALTFIAGFVWGKTHINPSPAAGEPSWQAPAMVRAIETSTPEPTPTPTPAASVVVDYRVAWTTVQGFNPFTIPVEETGFYVGQERTISYAVTDPNDVPDQAAYAWRIFPYLKDNGDVSRNVYVNAVRDQTDKNIVLASITAPRNPNLIVLSVNGEKSWCVLNLLPVGQSYNDAADIRIVHTGEEIHLYAMDSRLGFHWWGVTVKKSELPCS